MIPSDYLELIAMEIFLWSLVLSYTWGVLGISLGYHRGLSHRSFKLPRPLEYFFVTGGYLVFEGGPIFWVASHRLHHRYSDEPGKDPHTPLDGVWHSILGWMSKPVVIIEEDQYKVICPDLFRDPYYRFLHAGGGGRDGYLCLAINVVFRLAILTFFGPWAFAGNILGSIGAFIAPLMVNSICHLKQFGYRNYETPELSRNVWFVALASFGEGWHNNHHKFPQSARHGLKPSEFDFSWCVLSVLKPLGLVKNIRLPKDPALAGTNAEGANVKTKSQATPPAVTANKPAPPESLLAKDAPAVPQNAPAVSENTITVAEKEPVSAGRPY